MNQAHIWLLITLLFLLSLWLLWVWFGFEPDLTKNTRSLRFATSAAYNEFLAITKPEQLAHRLAFLKKREAPVFAELIKHGLLQLEGSFHLEFVSKTAAFTVIQLEWTNGERLMVACTQRSLRKNATMTEEFGLLCQTSSVAGLFIHLGMTSRFQANYLRQTYAVELVSGPRLIKLLTGQLNHLNDGRSILKTSGLLPFSPVID